MLRLSACPAYIFSTICRRDHARSFYLLSSAVAASLVGAGAVFARVCSSAPRSHRQEEKENIADIWAAYHDERPDSLGTVMPGDALADLQAKAKKW